MNKYFVQLLSAGFLLFVFMGYASAHCEIPCGIYGDRARIDLIAEHITTIEKSMKQIQELQKTTPLNYNQITRWVMNKEKHATDIQVIVSQYFLTQRIKPDSENYQDKLVLLHKMLIEAMHCKQTTDLEKPSGLRKLLNEFSNLYFHDSKK